VICTVVPADPEHGVNDVMVGEQDPGLVLVKSVGLFAVPPELVTWIVPPVVPATVAQILVAETILNAVTGVPPDIDACHGWVVEVRSCDHHHTACRATGRRERRDGRGNRECRGLEAEHDQGRRDPDSRYASTEVAPARGHGFVLASRKPDPLGSASLPAPDVFRSSALVITTVGQEGCRQRHDGHGGRSRIRTDMG
jgi:hypothetical protein